MRLVVLQTEFISLLEQKLKSCDDNSTHMDSDTLYREVTVGSINEEISHIKLSIAHFNNISHKNPHIIINNEIRHITCIISRIADGFVFGCKMKVQ